MTTTIFRLDLEFMQNLLQNMKILIKPLYSKLNSGINHCPLQCQDSCRVVEKTSSFQAPDGHTCPLSSHQVETAAAVFAGDADIIFNISVTGDGKSLAASLPTLLDSNYRMVGLYPTNELVEDQYRGQQKAQKDFGFNPDKRIDLLYGQELTRRVKVSGQKRSQELALAIKRSSVVLTNPDLFHLMLHFRYRDLAYDNADLPLLLADFPDYWVFDEFHIFGAHQEAAVLNNLCFLRSATQEKRTFLFTSATPKTTFVNQLQQAGFKVKTISGEYSSEKQSGYRSILQPVELEFVQLKDARALDWLQENANQIQSILNAETRGRGLIILNSVAQAGQAVRLLREVLEGVTVREISGRIDRQIRAETQEQLQKNEGPVLVVATSAVDVGVDFKIHLLIFESSNSATVIQRLGRLGRHSGFDRYQAFCLLPAHALWIQARLEKSLGSDAISHSEGGIERQQLNEVIATAFNSPQEFDCYRRQWGKLQAQGMLAQIQAESESAQVMQPVCDRIATALKPVYGSGFESTPKQWYGMGQKKVDQAIREELLRFRGSTAIQSAVWDDTRFYTYDFLRLLPYIHLEVMDEADFLAGAEQYGYAPELFNYAQVYLKVQQWSDERLPMNLRCNRESSELGCCNLILLQGLQICNHPQEQLLRSFKRKSFLTFLIPLKKRQVHWDIAKALYLSPLFGLYQLTDASEQSYTCAFNQDALLLDALRKENRLTKFCRQSSSMFL